MPVPPNSPRAVFLDRDGVLNRDSNYVFELDKLEILPGVIEGLNALKSAGFLLVVITNQSGIARGKFTLTQAKAFNAALRERLQALGGPMLDRIYMCPHHPDGSVAEFAITCDCRKPEPGMILSAAREFGLDLKRSFLVGDKASDIEAGHRAKVGKCYLVASDQYESGSVQTSPVTDLRDAAAQIISASALSSYAKGS